jgi:predicted phosphodiesterase
MKRIGLLSDTHGYWDERYARYFAECDEIWHAGDIGSQELAMRLNEIRPLKPYTETSTVESCAKYTQRLWNGNARMPAS